ncbi:type II secretion system (T2SS), E, N-terminal domain protein [Collimonas arenae]|uniref:Type II secretion system (T2SS), E, N-terminal domain protein n=1 Tax=Collimonas arenae TaxID=279058 RepID=A0A127QDX4_9BURK|nr:GspE/PulE family protein [Collimonas arenae]AMO98369.1 type II secretion system (T2SS), E, N-terminal domain protein [Collimonas arenae]AMP08247.1 type II secretion system (T2SS), E, N-terminal domain protein [Collimonas arenae]
MNRAIPARLQLDPALIQKARQVATHSQRSFILELESMTGHEGRPLVAEIARQFRMQVIETAAMLTMTPAFDLLPLSKAMQRHCVLLRQSENNLIGVISDPFDPDIQTWMDTHAKAHLSYHLALQADIQAYLSKQEESARAVDNLAPTSNDNRRDNKTAASLSFASVSAFASPAVKLVNSTLYDALKAGASDIHMESTPNGLAVKYRIDGVLDHATTINNIDVAEQAVSRLKVLAELDIAERRVPQDGSFRVEASGREIDLRISIMPSIHGEDAVIRILDKRAMVETYGALTLEALGFDATSLVTLRMLAEEAYGMLLVTGPTGSGKTTTLYATLTEIHNGRDKIITIEDPVEYQLPGILQIPVNEKKGLTFAKGLRSILRHDPDKIMVGEIRDKETAEIAVQSALTGHLVLTTVHANNVFDVFGRFTHMGIDPYAFVSALNGIWAQRLIRLNCPHCAIENTPSDNDLARVHLTGEQVQDYQFKQGAGCGDCRGTGYKGRHAIAEILTLNDEIREMIIEKRSIRQIKEAARLNGTRTLRESALELVKCGATTLEEIKRVTLHA